MEFALSSIKMLAMRVAETCEIHEQLGHEVRAAGRLAGNIAGPISFLPDSAAGQTMEAPLKSVRAVLDEINRILDNYEQQKTKKARKLRTFLGGGATKKILRNIKVSSEELEKVWDTLYKSLALDERVGIAKILGNDGARAFWLKHFPLKHTVDWSLFQAAFQHEYAEKSKDTPIKSMLAALQAVLDADGDGNVSVYEFNSAIPRDAADVLTAIACSFMKLPDYLKNPAAPPSYADTPPAFDATPATPQKAAPAEPEPAATPATKEKLEDLYSTPLGEWSVDQVATWLGALKVSEDNISAFTENMIDGESLAEITDDELKEDLEISKKFVRKKIIKEIAKAKAKSNPPAPAGPSAEEIAAEKAAHEAAQAERARQLEWAASLAKAEAERQAKALAEKRAKREAEAKAAAEAVEAAAAAAAEYGVDIQRNVERPRHRVDPKNLRRWKDFRVGDALVAQDLVQKWYEAFVTEVVPAENKIKVHFNGWSNKWDEWLNLSDPRVAPIWQPHLPEGLDNQKFTKTGPRGRRRKKVPAKYTRPWGDFKPGDLVTCRDTLNTPYESTILAIGDKGLMIHYNGWSDRWNEWIPVDSPRLGPIFVPAGHDEVVDPQAAAATTVTATPTATATAPSATFTPVASATNSSLLEFNSRQPRRARGKAPLPNWGELAAGDVLLAKDVAGKFYESTVLRIESGRVFVHFHGWAEKWDAWVNNGDLRPLYQPYSALSAGAKIGPKGLPRIDVQNPRKWQQFASGDMVYATDVGKTWYEAVIKEISSSAISVHFNGWDTKWDEAIPIAQAADRLRPIFRPVPRSA